MNGVNWNTVSAIIGIVAIIGMFFAGYATLRAKVMEIESTQKAQAVQIEVLIALQHVLDKRGAVRQNQLEHIQLEVIAISREVGEIRKGVTRINEKIGVVPHNVPVIK